VNAKLKLIRSSIVNGSGNTAHTVDVPGPPRASSRRPGSRIAPHIVRVVAGPTGSGRRRRGRGGAGEQLLELLLADHLDTVLLAASSLDLPVSAPATR